MDLWHSRLQTDCLSSLCALYCSFPPSLMLLLYFFLTPCLLFSLFFPFFAHTLSNVSLRFHWLITALFSGAIRPPHYQPCTLFPLYTSPWRRREGRRKELKMSVCMWKKGRGVDKGRRGEHRMLRKRRELQRWITLSITLNHSALGSCSLLYKMIWLYMFSQLTLH